MSQEDVDRARAGYAALDRSIQSGDLDEWFREYAHPEIEWVPMQGALDIDVSVGHEAVKGRLMVILETIEAPVIEAEEIIDGGGKVCVAIHLSGRGRGSGITLEADWFHVLTVLDDKLVRIEWYADRSEALEAAGLSE